MEYNEPTTVGLTPTTKSRLKALKENGHFGEEKDAYIFAVSLALRCGAMAERGNFGTIFNIGSLDSSKELYEAVKALRQNTDEPVYKTVERLAEWGVNELYAVSETGEIDFSKWLQPEK